MGYSEATEHGRISAVPLSHLSIEVGHFLMGELVNGTDDIRSQFRSIVALLDGFVRAAELEFGRRPRVSTCFLIDDYFRSDTDPRLILPKVLDVAKECGLTIDYLAREAGCAEVPAVMREGAVFMPEIPLAQIVRDRIVAEPRAWENGSVPPTTASGWLCNGVRSTGAEPGQAMHPERPPTPPEQMGRRFHSIFLDVEMSTTPASDMNGRTDTLRKWSCPFLAAVWQLMRLGVLRVDGRPVVEPMLWDPKKLWPDRWADLPAVVKLNKGAKPFAAYRSLSILPQRYLEIEHAVRVILDHVHLDQDVVQQVVRRGSGENVEVPRRVAERLAHYLLAGT
ncbi:SCO2522 family protein [Nocardia bovistercoris]|uniref:SCO2522 family protein n=1 Tax=Nocardia bovistercoris TaxID=2785916 RepID=UPI002FCCC4A0